MKLRQYLRRAMAAALCLMLCAGLVQPALAASGKIPGFSSSRKCSLTLAYGQAMEGVTVRLYRVASVDADVRFQAEGKFQEYLEGVNLNRLTQSGWVELAKCLRNAGLTVEAIVEYVRLSLEGDSTIRQRYELLKRQREELVVQRQRMDEAIGRLEHKIDVYAQKLN